MILRPAVLSGIRAVTGANGASVSTVAGVATVTQAQGFLRTINSGEVVTIGERRQQLVFGAMDIAAGGTLDLAAGAELVILT